MTAEAAHEDRTTDTPIYDTLEANWPSLYADHVLAEKVAKDLELSPRVVSDHTRELVESLDAQADTPTEYIVNDDSMVVEVDDDE